MSIIIGADLVPTESNKDLFAKGDLLNLIGEELINVLNKSEIRIFNLEVPLSNKETPIYKCGPNLIASPDTIKGIKSMNPTLLTLANNHILDHGIEGLNSTKNILIENKIPFIGVGDNLLDASKAYTLNINGLKIGVYACAEYEFTIAREFMPGANPFDPLESLDHIQNLKNESDYVIVLYHGGKEHYRYPSPYLQKVCRKIVEKGADLVVCQHSHCIGCFEKYKESNIIYGQGNFIFDGSDSEFWQTSLLIKLSFNKNIDLEFVPICKDNNKIRLATSEEAKNILYDFYKRSENICKPNFIQYEYDKFVDENMHVYMSAFSAFNKITRKINTLSKGKLTDIKYKNNHRLAIRNYIECEAHRELIISGLTKNR